MYDKKIIGKLKALLLVPPGIALAYIFSKYPSLVEKFYSEAVYRPTGKVLSKVTGIFPFSIAELIVVFLPAVFIIYTIRALAKTISPRGINLMPVLEYIVNILVIASIALIVFLGVWGLNYYRMPFADISGLETKPASISELESICKVLIERANELRQKVSVNAEGNMDIPGSSRDILNSCYKGYEAISDEYPYLGGSYGNPKPVILSKLMNYTGICGIYFPFTGEANVNVSIPESSLPATASHEMAHQRGFSREDEANYISYLACKAHPDVNFRYSGILLALTNSMNALYKSSQSSYFKLSKGYSKGVRHDLTELNNFWAQYEGPVERTSEKINNTYLKANNQKDGVKSYGRMVDLLIAEYRKEHK